MKLAVIFDPDDHKLSPASYSWTYRDMFLALCDAFEDVQYVTGDGSAQDIDADVIVFWDVHSSQAVTLDGIENHPALKYEYFNDPHQRDQDGTYSNGQRFHKLGPKGRCIRARDRGVQYIICPYRDGFAKYIKPHAGDMELLWFPVAPKPRRRVHSLLTDRKAEVLANGHLWGGEDGFRPYEFRRWAFQQKCVTVSGHALDGRTPKGYAFQGWLAQYAGALALCDTYIVPKYLEIPLAGCVCVCQMLPEYAEMGFADGVNCVAVNKEDFKQKVYTICRAPETFQVIADAGRQLVESKYTAAHFAATVKEHARRFAKGSASEVGPSASR